jgi:ABC-type Fe3+-hydroxamate transport system substrate-binding protein
MAFKLTDQIGNEVVLNNYPPKRIVSLVPSQTELLFDLGLNQEVVGITKFCVHPKEWFTYKTRVGGTKNAKIEKILALNPDLVIANKEENTQEIVEACLSANIATLVTDVITVEDAIQMIKLVGESTGKLNKSIEIADKVEKQFLHLRSVQPLNKKYAYLIWNEPIMVAANQTFINSVLAHAGFENVFTNELRYPETSIKQLVEDYKPEVLFLSSEPFPFKEKHVDFFQKKIPNVTVKIVDGELISWYGSRLLKTAKYLLDLQSILK